MNATVLKNWIRRTQNLVVRRLNRFRYQGSNRYCPVCEQHVSMFVPFGLSPRLEAKCPVCGALERHRQLWLFLARETNLLGLPRQRMLHVAPEAALEPLLSRNPHIDYVSADFEQGRAMVKMDVTDICYSDESFDVLHCSHVLEHVVDDRRAMREFYRVLKCSGWAVLQVPITGEITYEDPSITDPSERERAFGQWDHVRIYGRDFEGRLREAGFVVRRCPTSEIATEEEQEVMGIRGQQEIYLCAKNPSALDASASTELSEILKRADSRSSRDQAIRYAQ